jgi:pimeloyl-ACP methyl ester carboxylesterase
VPPAEAATRISPVPLLIVHGDKDLYFPPEHARQLYAGAREPKDLWLIPGFGHAERAADDGLIDRIVAWVTDAISPAAEVAAPPLAEKPLAEKPLAEKALAQKPLTEKPLAEKEQTATS